MTEDDKKIIKLAIKLYDAVILEQKGKCFVATPKEVEEYKFPLANGHVKNKGAEITEDMQWYDDWYAYIRNLKKENISTDLLTPEVVKKLGHITLKYDEEYKTYGCHINSKKYHGNGFSKDPKEAIFNCLCEALIE